MTEPAPATKKEVARLVDAQITALRRKSSLSDLDLIEYELRADRLKELYRELDNLKSEGERGWLRPGNRRLRPSRQYRAA
jgi:hypothetical protein